MAKSNIITIIFLLLFSGCKIDRDDAVDDSSLKFSTTDDSELFFVNVRQLYYEIEEMEAAKMKVYRIKSRPESTGSKIFPIIVWNWMYDEAYVIFEGDYTLNENTQLLWSNSSESGSISFSGGDKMEQLKFANFIFNGLKSSYNYKLTDGKREIPFLINSEEREAFRVTMTDYYRLVNIL